MTRSGQTLTEVKKIVVHYVGNPNTTAIANRDYFESLSKQNEKYASAHYIVGLDGEIIYCIPENEVAWHSGNMQMNQKSIGIENCHPDISGKFNQKTYDSLIELLVYLCQKYNLSVETDVIRHYDVIGKNCPKYYVENSDAWETLKSDVLAKLNNNDINSGSNDNKNESEEYVVTSTIGLNCRQEPNISAQKVTAYKYNQEIEVSEIQNGWGRTSDGWICMEYVKPATNQNTQKYVVISTIGLNCRQEPNILSQKVTAYKYNQEIEVSEIQNGWGKTGDGWVSMNYIKPLNSENLKKYIVISTIGLNCRQEPNISSKIVTAYKYNQEIEISEIQNDWGRTNDGWVSMNYVKTV